MEQIKHSLRTIDTSSLVDKVEANLVALLRERKLRVGDAIPKEMELAELLGVSRTVVREALLRLRMLGLIESKKKKGAIITSPEIFGTLNKTLNPYLLNKETLRDIFEIRLALEIGMADFIFHRIKPSDIEELRSIVAKEPAATEQHLFNTEHEVAFHGKLYQISGNESLKKFQNLLLPVFEYVHSSGQLKKVSTVRKFVSHKGLVDILENGSPELFRNAMRNHLENHFIRLFGED
jgi:GntR family transcriptional regulator, transcriptional repressor for pyruvate dehydrogenase complex